MTMEHKCANDDCKNPANNRCSRCNAVWYCSKDCQRTDWRQRHKGLCGVTTPAHVTSQTESIVDIPCVMIQANHRGYRDINLPSTDPIFTSEPIPVTVQFGYPLVMKRTQFGLQRSPATDNQHATWLNINPSTGWAPDPWQHSIGNVIVANANKSPLTVDVLSAIVDYVSEILDEFGEGRGSDVRRKFYNRRRLDDYITRHGQSTSDYQAQLKEIQEKVRTGELKWDRNSVQANFGNRAG